ncbi:MAG: tripartite tricarboxylate transporter TctB family protein [Oxalobacteraceae bacterium]
MKFNDAVSGVALLALAIAVLFNISAYPAIPGQSVGPAVFPGLLAVLLIFCALLLIRKGMLTSPHAAWVTLGDWIKSPYHLRNFLVTLACLVFYIFASEPLGFLLCSTAILAVMFWALAVRRTRVLPLALIITLVIHTVFYKGLRVPLPWGVLQSLQW